MMYQDTMRESYDGVDLDLCKIGQVVTMSYTVLKLGCWIIHKLAIDHRRLYCGWCIRMYTPYTNPRFVSVYSPQLALIRPLLHHFSH